MAKTNSIAGSTSEPLTLSNLNYNYDMIEIGLTFFSDASLNTVVDSGMTGSVQLSGTPVVNSYNQNIVNGNIDLSSETSFKTPVRIDTKLSSLTATPLSVTGATYYQLFIIGEPS